MALTPSLEEQAKVRVNPKACIFAAATPRSMYTCTTAAVMRLQGIAIPVNSGLWFGFTVHEQKP